MGYSLLERNDAFMHIRIFGVMTLADLAALQFAHARQWVNQ